MSSDATLRLRRIALRTLISLLALICTCAVAAPQPTAYPRAIFAADSQRVTALADRVLGSGAALTLIEAMAGPGGKQHWLTWLGDFSIALDAPTHSSRAWTRALAIAQWRDDATAIRALTLRLARAAIAVGDYPRASEFATRLDALARHANDVYAQAHAENMLGILARRSGHLDEAIAHQQRAITLFRSIHNVSGTLRALANLGTTWRDRGDFAKALETQLEAAGNRGDDGERLEHVYRNLGLLYRDVEDRASSRDYFEKALQVARERGAPSAYSTAIGSYATLLNDMGEFAAARDAAAEALAIDEALGDRAHQGLDHLELGRALLGLRDMTAANGHLDQALQLGRAIGQRETMARALLHLAETAMAAHDTLHARGYIDEAIAGLERTHLRSHLADAYALRERLADLQNDEQTALRFSRKYTQLREELNGIRTSRQLAVLEARHERADAEHRVALLAKDNELQAARIERQALVRDIVLLALASLLLAFAILFWRHRGVRQLNRDLEARNIEIERQRAALDSANTMLRAQASDLLRAATTDALTQVANRRHLLDCLAQSVAESTRREHPLALMLIDFDNFKNINDEHGHLFGDQVLATGAATLREALGADHIVGRYGGEEFVAIVSHDSDHETLALAERLRERVAVSLARLAPSLNGYATISVGVAFLADLGPQANAEALLDAADRAVYLAKRDGRNCVRRFRP